MTRWLTTLACICIVGCGDSADRPDSGVLRFDADMLSPDSSVGDSGDTGSDASTHDAAGDTDPPDPACNGLPDAVMTSSGVLTAYPGIDYVAQEPGEFRIVSANFVITEDDDSRGDLVEIFVVMESLLSEEKCTFFPELRLDGVDLLGQVQGPPHFTTQFESTVTTPCLPARGRVVVRGLARGIEPSTASRMTVALDPGSFSRHEAAVEPARTERIVNVEGEYLVEGEVTPHVELRNYSLKIYGVDSRGLIAAEMLAFPGELETLPAGVPVPYDTPGTECPFEVEYAFQSWIVGSGSSKSEEPMDAGMAEWQQRMREREALRERTLRHVD